MLIYNTQSAMVRLANTALVDSLIPRYKEVIYPQICGTTQSSSEVEPFTFDGSAPLLSMWTNLINLKGLVSYHLDVPNPIFKAAETLQRAQFEFDQTRVFAARTNQFGLRLMGTPDLLLASQMIKGSTSGSQYQTFNGRQYTTTFDGQPVYSTTHADPSGANQSNILQGSLPDTKAAIYAQDISTTINRLINDIELINDTVMSIRDDQGSPMFSTWDSSKHLTLMVPPCLFPAARLLQKTGATIAGSGGTSGGSGSTTNIGPELIARVIPFGLLNGCPDVSTEQLTQLSPTYPTQYYAMVTGDYVQPWYFQNFTPVKKGQTVPLGEDPEAQYKMALNSAIEGGLPLSVAQAAARMYSSMEVDNNLGALGSQAQPTTAFQEQFFIAARWRGNMFPGPWFLNYLVNPTSGS